MTERPEMLNERKKTSPLAVVLSTVLTVLLLLAIAFFVFRFWFNTHYFVVEVDGSSLEYTMQNGDSLYAKKGSTAKRGDVVIIDVSDYHGEYSFSGTLIIKRLIATEGDSVRIRDGGVEIKYADAQDYIRLEEPYVHAATDPKPTESSQSEWSVGEGEIFFLGDNREVSQDSRYVGCLSRKKIVGVVPDWAIKHKTSAKTGNTNTNDSVRIKT